MGGKSTYIRMVGGELHGRGLPISVCVFVWLFGCLVVRFFGCLVGCHSVSCLLVGPPTQSELGRLVFFPDLPVRGPLSRRCRSAASRCWLKWVASFRANPPSSPLSTAFKRELGRVRAIVHERVVTARRRKLCSGLFVASCGSASVVWSHAQATVSCVACPHS